MKTKMFILHLSKCTVLLPPPIKESLSYEKVNSNSLLIQLLYPITIIITTLLLQFTEEYLRRIPRNEWPRVIVVADGSCGDSCSVLGISSDYTVETCHAYGANATIERLDQRQVRTHTCTLTHTQT